MPNEIESQLIQAVLDNPYSDSARKAIGAYWSEVQSPRGELVQLQMDIAHLKRCYRPAWAWEKETARVDELLAEHGAIWAGEIANLVEHYVFHRGFVEEVELSARLFVRKGYQLCQMAPLRHLTLYAVAENASELAQCPALSQIVSLRVMPHDGFDDAAARALMASPYLQQLRWLDLRDQDLSAAVLGELVQSPTLANLKAGWLDGNAIDYLAEVERCDWDMTPLAMDDGHGIIQIERTYGSCHWLHPLANHDTFVLDRDAFLSIPQLSGEALLFQDDSGQLIDVADDLIAEGLDGAYHDRIPDLLNLLDGGIPRHQFYACNVLVAWGEPKGFIRLMDWARSPESVPWKVPVEYDRITGADASFDRLADGLVSSSYLNPHPDLHQSQVAATCALLEIYHCYYFDALRSCVYRYRADCAAAIESAIVTCLQYCDRQMPFDLTMQTAILIGAIADTQDEKAAQFAEQLLASPYLRDRGRYELAISMKQGQGAATLAMLHRLVAMGVEPAIKAISERQ